MKSKQETETKNVISSTYRENNADSRTVIRDIKTPEFTLPSNVVLSLYGIPRSTAIYIQHNNWSVSQEYRNIFSSYYLLKWSAAYFQDKMHQGTVERDGVVYQVIYYNCNVAAISRGVGQLLMSFRELQNEYKAQPVVLVTVA